MPKNIEWLQYTLLTFLHSWDEFILALITVMYDNDEKHDIFLIIFFVSSVQNVQRAPINMISKGRVFQRT
jgi:hypothetical protein